MKEIKYASRLIRIDENTPFEYEDNLLKNSIGVELDGRKCVIPSNKGKRVRKK